MAPGVAEPAPTPVSAGRIAGLNVLCIDNERAVLDGMCVCLSGWGCKGHNGSKRRRSHRPAATRSTPSRISSWLTITSMVAPASRPSPPFAPAERSHTPVIIISADHTPEVQREIRRRGYAFLRKPLKAAALRAPDAPAHGPARHCRRVIERAIACTDAWRLWPTTVAIRCASDRLNWARASRCCR